MRRNLWTKSVLALGTAVALGAAFAQQGAAQAARTGGGTAAGGVRATTTGHVRAATGDGSGDFIVRCFFNTNIAPEDPIGNPGSAHDDNLYAFFGNLAAGGAANDGTAFPSIQSGDYSVTSDTMEQNGLSTPTNCQDNKDTAGYSAPAPYMVTSARAATPWQNNNGCTTSCTASGSNPNFHQRVYYIPHSPADQEIPDGAVMIAGFPNGCQTVVGGHTPDSCTNPATTSYPQDPSIIEYACGADSGNGFATPDSEWPYDCTNFVNKDKDDNYSDGEVAIVRFPYCWDGSKTGNFPAPNSPAVNGLPTETVPGYVAPWIVYNVWKKDYPNMGMRPVNDFAYPQPGTVCSNSVNAPYTHTVVQLEERIHLLTYGAGWGDPSSCVGDTGIGWNSLNNTENANNPNDTNDPANNLVGDGGTNGETTSDATVPIGPGIWGPYKCVTANAPDPDPGASTLSFACSHSGDPNCNIALSAPGGCDSAGGTCYVGAYSPSTQQYGWETLHAEYWQTWQEASVKNGMSGGNLDNTLVNNQLTDGVASDVGTFGDLMEDCVNGLAANKCPAFVVTSQGLPKQVYGTNGNAP